MNVPSQPNDLSGVKTHVECSEIISLNEIYNEKILCDYCGRTKNNGIRCIGRCVADDEY